MPIWRLDRLGVVDVAARKNSLRAVAADEKPTTPRTIEEAALRGDELSELRLTRVAIARKLDDPNCQARDMAALSKRLMELAREITAVEARMVEEAEDAESFGDETWDEEAI